MLYHENRRNWYSFSDTAAAAAAAKSLQSCPTLCNPIDGSPPSSPVPGILQARTLEWVVISFSNAWKWKMKVKSLSCVWLFMTPWTAAYQAPPSIGFSRQEYWSGVPLPSQTLHVLIYSFSGTLHVHLILIAALENSQLHRNQRLCNLPIMSQLGWKDLRVRSSFSWSQMPCSQTPCSQRFFSSRQRYKSSLKP